MAIDNSRRGHRAKTVIVGQSSAVYVILRQCLTYYHETSKIRRVLWFACYLYVLCAFACTLDLMAMILHYFATRTRHVFQRMFLRSFVQIFCMESFQRNDQRTGTLFKTELDNIFDKEGSLSRCWIY